MAQLELRQFKGKTQLLILTETEEESKIIDRAFGAAIPTRVHGEVTLSDGYGEHYIRLERGAKEA